jgi:hypothetical protein
MFITDENILKALEMASVAADLRLTVDEHRSVARNPRADTYDTCVIFLRIYGFSRNDARWLIGLLEDKGLPAAFVEIKKIKTRLQQEYDLVQSFRTC